MNINYYEGPKTLKLGPVELFVKDIEKMKLFYENLIGLEPISSSEKLLELGNNNQTVMRLFEDKTLDFVPRKEAGLYHTALVFKSQAHLAIVIQKILIEMPALYQGSADHLATEAFYFADPEGNGVELYFDKPSKDWIYEADGKPKMGSIYIDEMEYIEKNANQKAESNEIKMGHVHLKVGDINTAKNFYENILLLDEMFLMPTALFVSRDNYHHHLGMNIWESMGAGDRQSGFTGLKSFEMNYLDKNLFENVLENIKKQNVKHEKVSESNYKVYDPWATEIIVTW